MVDPSPHPRTPAVPHLPLAWLECSCSLAVTLGSKLSVASEDTNVVRLLLSLQPAIRPGVPSTLPLLGVSLKLDCNYYHLYEIQYQTNLAHEGKRVVIAYSNDW